MRRSFERSLRVDAEDIFRAAVDRVMPSRLFSYCLSLEGSILSLYDGEKPQLYDLSKYDHVVIAAFGKASIPMAVSLASILGERVTEGLVVSKAPESGQNSRFSEDIENLFASRSIRYIEGSHPVPDERSVQAGREMLNLAMRVKKWEEVGKRTLVFVLVSGGGSALLAVPASGISLEDKAEATRLLLACGATIHEINTVRKHLSAIKGGLLAKAFSPSRIIALILSDVMGDDLDTIASGPTVPDTSTWQDVKSIFDRYALLDKLPRSIVQAVEDGLSGIRPETPKPEDPTFDLCSTILVGTNYHAIQEAERKSKELGYNTLVLGSRFSGEAREIGKVFSGIVQDIILHGVPVCTPACIIAGGETTVTLRSMGKGGRNQEMALSVLNEFNHFPRSVRSGLEKTLFLSAGSDGNDGPTDAAGAFADIDTLENARRLALNPSEFLANNDSYTFFYEVGGLFVTGPTGTNVCDIQLLIVR